MDRILLISALLLAICINPSVAQVPGDDCSSLPAGATRLKEDQNGDLRDVILICDGSLWQTMQFAVDRIQDTDNDTNVIVDTSDDDIIRMNSQAKPISTVFATGSDTTFNLISSAATPNMGIVFEENVTDSAFIGLNATGEFEINTITAGSDIIFRANGIERGRLHNTGEFTINTTAPPQAALDIDGYMRALGLLQNGSFNAYLLFSGDSLSIRAGDLTNADTYFDARGSTLEYIRIATNDNDNPAEIIFGDDNLFVNQVTDRIGINNNDPKATLDVSDIIQIGNTTVSCTSLVAGGLRYNPTFKCLEVCSGSGWGCNTEVQCADDIPDTFSFTDVTNATTSTLIESNIIQITGLAECSITASIDGSGTPEYRICNDAACTSVEHDWSNLVNGFANNQYLQVRLISTSLGQDTRSLSVRVGARSTTWSVSTAGACPPDASPVPGSLCADNTVYVGTTVDSSGSNYNFYATPCRHSRTYENGTCVGVVATMPFNNDSTNYQLVGANHPNDGQQNTTAFVAETSATNPEAPYFAPNYCNDLGQFGEEYAYGYTDWYLPSQSEGNTMCPVFQGVLDWSTIWLSTEASFDRARYERSDCFSGSAGKRTQYSVRCVRRVLQ
ncbi:MAG: hypothetical protein AB8B83_03545 [Bdellovibrionales bacterium]